MATKWCTFGIVRMKKKDWYVKTIGEYNENRLSYESFERIDHWWFKRIKFMLTWCQSYYHLSEINCAWNWDWKTYSTTFQTLTVSKKRMLVTFGQLLLSEFWNAEVYISRINNHQFDILLLTHGMTNEFCNF